MKMKTDIEQLNDSLNDEHYFLDEYKKKYGEQDSDIIKSNGFSLDTIMKTLNPEFLDIQQNAKKILKEVYLRYYKNNRCPFEGANFNHLVTKYDIEKYNESQMICSREESEVNDVGLIQKTSRIIMNRNLKWIKYLIVSEGKRTFVSDQRFWQESHIFYNKEADIYLVTPILEVTNDKISGQKKLVFMNLGKRFEIFFRLNQFYPIKEDMLVFVYIHKN